MTGIDQNTLYDMQAVSIIQKCLKFDSNCIDVGAHLGCFLQEMVRWSPQGTHFAFEPLPDIYRQLSDLYRTYRNVKVFQVALSDTTGKSTFQSVITNPGYSGLKQRRYDQPNEEIQEIIIKTDTIDNVIPENIAIHFIKIDVEGAELGVLQGGIETIRKSRPVIVFEHGLGAADYYGTTPDDVYKLLTKECLLRIFVMEDWLLEKRALDKGEFHDQFYQGINYYFMAHA